MPGKISADQAAWRGNIFSCISCRRSEFLVIRRPTHIHHHRHHRNDVALKISKENTKCDVMSAEFNISAHLIHANVLAPLAWFVEWSHIWQLLLIELSAFLTSPVMEFLLRNMQVEEIYSASSPKTTCLTGMRLPANIFTMWFVHQLLH